MSSKLDLVGANCAVWRERFLRGEQFTPHEAHNFLRDARLLCEEAKVQYAELARLRAENAELRERLDMLRDGEGLRLTLGSVRGENARLRAQLTSKSTQVGHYTTSIQEIAAALGMPSDPHTDPATLVEACKTLRALIPSEAVLDTLSDAMAEHRDRMSMWEGRRDYMIAEAEAASEWVTKVEEWRERQ